MSSALFRVLALAAVAWGVAAAAAGAWTCDDAFISFRYARHLVDGLGLVFNAGERVEGYSNLLWTLWCALGLRFGCDVELWSIAWGIAFHAGSLALLVLRCARRDRVAGTAWFPIAALAAAVHSDWSAFATSGLETSLYTFLALLGFTLVIGAREGRARLACGGLAFGLAAVTRPEGILLGAVTAAYLVVARRGRLEEVFVFTVPCLVPWLAQLGFRIVYYGDLFPNTWYAKSAGLAWYSQGLLYGRLYFEKYAVLAAGIAAAIAALGISAWRARPSGSESSPTHDAPDPWVLEAALALALGAAQTAFVVRVGGDFMFARLLVPATPFYLILLELALLRLLPPRRDLALGAAAAVALAVFLTPHPLAGAKEISGIVDERLQYPPERREAQRRKGETLRRYFAGLPVSVAFAGSEARVVYYSRVPVAIECSAGLTDRFIARRPLERRGRPGHEKRPTAAYLVDERRVHLGLHPELPRELSLGDSALALPIRFGTARASVLRWDAPLMAELERRGARLDATPAALEDAVTASR